MEHNAEIEKIQGELAILQARYALYLRMAGITRSFFIIVSPIFGLAALVFVVRLFLLGVLYGLVFLGALLVFILGIGWYIKSVNLRWIDLVSPRLFGIYGPHFHPDGARPRSEAESLEWQIADHQRRLSQAAASIPGANRPD